MADASNQVTTSATAQDHEVTTYRRTHRWHAALVLSGLVSLATVAG